MAEMPANPSHNGLTARGWNWSLSDAKSYVADYGQLIIGQMYTTDDGKTRIYIRLQEGRTEPYLGMTVSGTATVDWGDGSASDSVTGSGSFLYKKHTYQMPGEYIISITPPGGSGYIMLGGDTTYGFSKILSVGENGTLENRVYQKAIYKIEEGANCYNNLSAFGYCTNLENVVMGNATEAIGQNTFNYCVKLKFLVANDNVRQINANAFIGCYSLLLISLPKRTTSIADNSFSSCLSLNKITPYSLGTAIFSGCENLSNVIIPNGTSSIQPYGFNNCFGLVIVTIPSSVTGIQERSFYNCTRLSRVRFMSQTPPTVANTNAFYRLPTDCIIEVPAGSLAAYTTATNYPSPSTYTYVEY
jgi:hypothetical protein